MENKQIIRDALIFLAGAGLGGVGTWLVAKTKYKKFADQEIAEVKEYYDKKYKETVFTPEEVEEMKEASGEEPKDAEEAYRQARDKAKKNLNKKEIVDYASFYKSDENGKPPIETSLAELEHPRDSDEDEDDPEEGKLVEDEFSEPDPEADDHEEENYIAGERMNEEDKRESNRDPYPIGEDTFYAEDNRNGQESLFYYTENDVLVDSQDQVVENRELVIGRVLTEPYWDDSGIIYVRNPRLRTDYEITRVEAAWDED